MATGVFNKQGDGLSPQTPIEPDFTSGPGGPLGYIPVMWEQIGETALTMTVRYQTQ
jgi:hypothetical protein